MLLIDLSSVVITSTIELLTTNKDEQMDENLIRHIVFSQILYYKKKFKEYGNPILCADSTHYWRKDVFKYFKQNRKKVRNESVIDWNEFFRIFNSIKNEIKENFPYILVEVNRMEADDIIAVLAIDSSESVMIVSSDKDMLQLQLKFGDKIKQYSPHTKKELTIANKDYCLMTHILKGDSGDGIPNILSDDDVFMVDGKRQKPIRQKFIDEVKGALEPFDIITDPVQRKKFKRNRLLIDVSYLPKLVIDRIKSGYEKECVRPKKMHIMSYFVEHRMKMLMDKIGEF